MSTSHAAPVESRDLRKAPLDVLAQHILDTHHVFTREVLQRIDQLLPAVCDVHGDTHPELHDVRDVFEGLRDELYAHLMKEEHVLFPYVMELARGPGARSPFGTVANPIRMMNLEHDSADRALVSLRRLTNAYAPPTDACSTYKSLCAALSELDRDLVAHMEIETNVLFPRAEEAERAGR